MKKRFLTIMLAAVACLMAFSAPTMAEVSAASLDVEPYRTTAMVATEPVMAKASNQKNTNLDKTNANSTELITASGVTVPILAYSKPRMLAKHGVKRVSKCGSGWVRPNDVQAKPYAVY